MLEGGREARTIHCLSRSVESLLRRRQGARVRGGHHRLVEKRTRLSGYSAHVDFFWSPYRSGHHSLCLTGSETGILARVKKGGELSVDLRALRMLLQRAQKRPVIHVLGNEAASLRTPCRQRLQTTSEPRDGAVQSGHSRNCFRKFLSHLCEPRDKQI